MAHLPGKTQDVKVSASPPRPALLPDRPYSRATLWLILALAALVMALWLLGTPAGLQGKADAIGYAVCHRIADRSFQVNGRPLPLCVRCTGVYLGALGGLAILLAAGRGRASRLPGRSALAVMGLFVVLTSVDGLNSYLHLFPGYVGPYEPQSWLRLVTGSLAGLSMIHLIGPVFNAVAWARPDPRPVLRSVGELGGMLVVIFLLDALVLLENPTVLLVLGLLTAAGPVIVLTMVWTVIVLSFTRRENSARSWADLAVPLIAAFTLTFLMIGGIDAVRYLLTGTWDGFDLSAFAPAS